MSEVRHSYLGSSRTKPEIALLSRKYSQRMSEGTFFPSVGGQEICKERPTSNIFILVARFVQTFSWCGVARGVNNVKNRNF